MSLQLDPFESSGGVAQNVSEYVPWSQCSIEGEVQIILDLLRQAHTHTSQ